MWDQEDRHTHVLKHFWAISCLVYIGLTRLQVKFGFWAQVDDLDRVYRVQSLYRVQAPMVQSTLIEEICRLLLVHG